jgi:tetratricopeptide (TPR) repeat protein
MSIHLFNKGYPVKNFYAIQLVFITELILYLLLLPHNGFTQNFSGFATVGVQADYSKIIGHYAESLNNGMGAGFFSFVPFCDWCMINGGITYNRFSLAESSNSSMQVFGVTIIPSFFYISPYHFTVYTGIGISLQYYTLSAIKTEQSDSTTKAGLVINVGVSKNIFTHTLIAAECGYALSELSHKKFQTIKISLKCGYQFALHSPEYYIAKEKEKETLTKHTILQSFNKGVEHLQAKDASGALRYFTQVLSLDPNHKESREYVASINQAIQQYDSALRLIAHNKDFEALPLINAASHYILDAEKLYTQLQQKHKPDIPDIINKAIEAFNYDYPQLKNKIIKIFANRKNQKTTIFNLKKAKL